MNSCPAGDLQLNHLDHYTLFVNFVTKPRFQSPGLGQSYWWTFTKQKGQSFCSSPIGLASCCEECERSIKYPCQTDTPRFCVKSQIQ